MNQNGGIHKGGFAVLCHRNGGSESPGILIDESRDNNRLENLQWGTARYNCNQRMHLKRLRNSHRGHTVSLETRRAISRGNRGREVYQCDLKGVVLKKWDYISIAARNLGISPSNISKCCRGLRESAGGFKWKYVIRGE